MTAEFRFKKGDIVEYRSAGRWIRAEVFSVYRTCHKREKLSLVRVGPDNRWLRMRGVDVFADNVRATS